MIWCINQNDDGPNGDVYFIHGHSLCHQFDVVNNYILYSNPFRIICNLYYLLMTLVLVRNSIYYHIYIYMCQIWSMHSMWFNKLFLTDIYRLKVGVAMTVCRKIRYCYSFLLGFNCTFQLYSSGFLMLWYGYKYHAILYIKQLHPTTVYRTVSGWVCFVLVLLSVLFINSYIESYFIMMVAIIIGSLCPFYSFWATYLSFPELGSSHSATTYLHGCFCPWTFSLNIGLNMLPSDSFMSCLDSLLGLYILHGSSNLCNWLSLLCLVPWINNFLYVGPFV